MDNAESEKGSVRNNVDIIFLLYVQVTVHRDELHIKQPTRYIKYPSSGVIYCTNNVDINCLRC